MLGTLLFAFLLVAVVLLWLDHLGARERAQALGQRLCAEAGVQLLDQSVALRRIDLMRDAEGRLGLRRWYGFELSTDGTDRHRASLRIAHGRLEEFSMPILRERMTSGQVVLGDPGNG